MKRRILGLVAASLVLGTVAPTAFAQNSVSLRPYKSAITLDGKVLSHPYEVVTSDGGTLTTYMPMYYIDQALAKAGYKTIWDGKAHTWILTAANVNPDLSSIQVGTGNTSITVNGKLVKKINTIVKLDPAGGEHAVPTVYLPIYYVQPFLEALGIMNTWDGSKRIWGGISPLTLAAGATYGPSTGSTSLEKNLVVAGTDVTVQNIKVDGNVYVNPGADGSVYLNNVTATGKIVVLSGADHSIHFNNVNAPDLEVYSSSSVHIVVEGSTQIGKTVIPAGEQQNVTLDQQSGSLGTVALGSSSKVILSGSFDSVTVTVGADVEVSPNAKVGTLNVDGSNTSVKVDAGAAVSNVTVAANTSAINVENDGTISTLTNNASSSGLAVSGSGQVTTTQGNTPTGGTTTTGGGGGGGGAPAGGGGGVSTPTPDQQAITALTTDLENIHAALSPSGLLAVDTAEGNAKTIPDTTWQNDIYGPASLSNQQKYAVSAVQDIVELSSYGALTGNNASTNVNQILSDIDKVYPSVTATDLHSFFLSFKVAVIGQVPSMLLNGVSKRTAVASALESAVQSNKEFQGFLGQIGLSVNQLGTIWTTVNPSIDPSQNALDALLTAAMNAPIS